MWTNFSNIPILTIRSIIAILMLFPMSSCQNKTPGNSSISKGEVNNEEIFDTTKLSEIKIVHAFDFENILDELNKEDLRSIDNAIKIFNHAEADSLSSDSMFVAFNEFTSSVIQNYDESHLIGEDKTEKGVTASQEMELGVHGVQISIDRGEVFLETDYSFISQQLKNKLSHNIIDYLALKTEDQKIPAADDNQLLLSPDSLAERIIKWEDYTCKYSSSMMIRDVENQCSIFFYIYLNGVENSPVFDEETKIINDRFKSSYLRYLQQFPGRKSTEIIKEYLNLLGKYEFRFNDQIAEYLGGINFLSTNDQP